MAVGGRGHAPGRVGHDRARGDPATPTPWGLSIMNLRVRVVHYDRRHWYADIDDADDPPC